MNRTSRLKALLTAAAAAAMLAACGNPPETPYVEARNLPAEGWAYTDALPFEPSKSPALPSNLTLVVHHDATYPYSNLWLRVEYTDRGRARADTFNIELADLHGRWLGKGLGAFHQVEVPVAQAIVPDSGVPIMVRHIMRIDTLRGIDRIGVSLLPSPSAPK